MRVLLSIRPEFAYKILSGEKKFEYRRRLFKNTQVTSIVIYATSHVGSLVGEFEVGRIISENPTNLWSNTKDHSGIDHKYFNEYFQDCTVGHAIEVKSPRTYETPILIRGRPGFVAPQSFRYVTPKDAEEWNLEMKIAA